MFKYKLTVPASGLQEADAKASALSKLAAQFDARTLQALADKGKSFLRHPIYGGTIRKQLGL